jgi:hypothetical protein
VDPWDSVISRSFKWLWYSSVIVVIMLGAERQGFNSLQEKLWDFFVFATAFRPALGSTQPRIHWVPGAPSLGSLPLWECSMKWKTQKCIKTICSYFFKGRKSFLPKNVHISYASELKWNRSENASSFVKKKRLLRWSKLRVFSAHVCRKSSAQD